MSEDPRTPLSRGRRLPFYATAVVVVPLLVLLPATWSSHSAADLFVLAAIEAALMLFLLTLWDPGRFHASGRGLLGIAAAAIVLGLALLEGIDTTPVLLATMVAFSAGCTYYALTGRFERRPQPKAGDEPDMAELRTDGPRLRYLVGGREWELHRDEILAVGELTTDSPGDDYSLCFLTGLDGEWRRLSFHSRGREDLLGWLHRELGGSFRFELRDSTRFGSRTLWPSALAGEPLFTLVDPTEAASPIVVSSRVLDELRRTAG